ncbi:MAG: phosphotransferase, partial [Dermatophilaceae bacterium]
MSSIVWDGFAVTGARPVFRAFRMPGRNEVYAYEEDCSGTKLVCKFYGARFGVGLGRAALMARREYENLNTLRRFNLVGSPHHVIRPLGRSRDINAVLAVEYYAGEEFSDSIKRAIQRGDADHLYWRLTALAYFLATQHTRTANGCGVDFSAECRYFDKLVTQLRNLNRVDQQDVEQLAILRDRWRGRPAMWQDKQVWLHGDATPGNFLFGHGLDVAAIDLERMRRGDRLFDLGRVA